MSSAISVLGAAEDFSSLSYWMGGWIDEGLKGYEGLNGELGDGLVDR